MPTVIDALVVTLGLDATGHTAGQQKAREEIDKTRETATKGVKATEKDSRSAEAEQRKQSEAAAKRQKDMDAHTKNLGDTFAKARNAAIGMLAAFTAGRGLSEFITSSTATNANLGRLAANLGMTSEEMSAWGSASELLGGSAEGMQQALGTLTSQFQGLRLGMQMPASDWLNALHISPSQLSTATGGLRAIGDALARLKAVDPARAHFIGQQLGLSEEAYNLITDPNREKLLKKGATYGGVTGAHTAEAAKLQQALSEVKQISTTLGNQILDDLTPAFVSVLGALRDLGTWLADPEHKLALDGLFAAAAGGAVVMSARIAMTLLGLGRMVGAFRGAAAAGVTAMAEVEGAAAAANTTISGGLLATIGAIGSGLALAGAGLAAWYLALKPGGQNNEDADLKARGLAHPGIPVPGAAPASPAPSPPGAAVAPTPMTPEEVAARHREQGEETVREWLHRRFSHPAAPAIPAPAGTPAAPVGPPSQQGPGTTPRIAQQSGPRADPGETSRRVAEEAHPIIRTAAEEFSRAISTELSRCLEFLLGKPAQASPGNGVSSAPGYSPNGQQATGGAAGPDGLFAALESKDGLPPGLLDQIWSIESNRGKDLSVSPAGAMGHFQIMPANIEDARRAGRTVDPYDLKQSAQEASTELAAFMKKYNGDVRKSLAAYNWGPGNVDHAVAEKGADWEQGHGIHGQPLPAETANYLARVIQRLATVPTRPVATAAAPAAPVAPVQPAAAPALLRPQAGLAVRPGQLQASTSTVTNNSSTAIRLHCFS